MNGINAIITETLESFPCPFWHARIHSKKTKNQASGNTKSASALNLDFYSLKTVKNEFLLIISHPVYGILFQQPELIKTMMLLIFLYSSAATYIPPPIARKSAFNQTRISTGKAKQKVHSRSYKNKEEKGCFPHVH